MAVKAMDCVTIIDYTDVSAVKAWYIAVSRTSSAPVVSSGATEEEMQTNGWDTVEPQVDTSKKVYRVDECIFGDGTYVWGDVSLSSSYEAAIEAYNKADNAETVASGKIDAPDGATDTSLLTSFSVIQDLINFSATQINFGATTVADNLTDLNSAVSIDTETATIYVGDRVGFHVELNGTELGFYDNNTKVAYIRNNQLFIEQSVVLSQMDVGFPYGETNPSTGESGLGQWSWKVHPNNGNPSKNNLNLKWVG